MTGTIPSGVVDLLRQTHALHLHRAHQFRTMARAYGDPLFNEPAHDDLEVATRIVHELRQAGHTDLADRLATDMARENV